MKIKIKKTGEIKIVQGYARVPVEDCDSYGNPLEYSLDEIELIQPSESGIDWRKFKANAIVEITKSVISSDLILKELNKASSDKYTSELMVDFSSEIVDELIKRLKGLVWKNLRMI